MRFFLREKKAFNSIVQCKIFWKVWTKINVSSRNSIISLSECIIFAFVTDTPGVNLNVVDNILMHFHVYLSRFLYLSERRKPKKEVTLVSIDLSLYSVATYFFFFLEL